MFIDTTIQDRKIYIMPETRLDRKTDEELMIEFCSSMYDHTFRELMTRHHGKALGYIQKKVFNRQLAEDIVQDSFLKVVRNKDQYDQSMKFSAWFYSILKNTCIDAARQRQRHQSKLEKIALNIDLFKRESDQKNHDLAAVLSAVKEPDRTILVDHFVYGMTFVELAEKLGQSKEALKKRAQRALKKIRTTFPRR